MGEKRSFKITYHDDNEYIEVKFMVNLDWSVMQQITAGVSKLILENDCWRILLDITAVELTLSVVKMVQTPERLRQEFSIYGVDLMRIKRAFLIAQNDENYQFFETVMINRAQTFRIFQDRESALNWLCES